jgi:hypothetical protein
MLPASRIIEMSRKGAFDVRKLDTEDDANGRRKGRR